MKKTVYVFAVIMVAIVYMACSKKTIPAAPTDNSNTSTVTATFSPVNTGTATATRTISATFTVTPSITQTPTITMTRTAFPTPVPRLTVYVNLYFNFLENASGTVTPDGHFFKVSMCDNNSTADGAVINVNMTPVPQTDSSITMKLTTYTTYDITYTPGAAYDFEIYYKEVTLTASFTAPGNILISTDGLTFNWDGTCTSNAIEIRKQGVYVLNRQTNVSKPYAISPLVYSVPGYYTIFTMIGTTRFNFLNTTYAPYSTGISELSYIKELTKP